MPSREFSDEPCTKWMTDAGCDRGMILLADFWFKDSKGKRWDAGAGRCIDGASIPKPLWALVGSPYTGDYRRASIVHDIACKAAVGDEAARRAADRMFFEACSAGGCSWWEATVLYVGVRIGSWWNDAAIVPDDRIKLVGDVVDEQLKQEFRQASELVLRLGETDDPDVVEERTDAAFAKLALQRAALISMTILR